MTSEELDALPVVVGLATAAKALGVGRNQVYALARSGKFPVRVREVCGRYRVTKADLLTWLGYIPDADANGGRPARDDSPDVLLDGDGAGQEAASGHGNRPLRPVRGGGAA